MNNTTTNKAPIGSLWSIRINGVSTTYEVLSNPIPGNDLREVVSRPFGQKGFLGKNWFRRGVRLA